MNNVFLPLLVASVCLVLCIFVIAPELGEIPDGPEMTKKDIFLLISLSGLYLVLIALALVSTIHALDTNWKLWDKNDQNPRQ